LKMIVAGDDNVFTHKKPHVAFNEGMKTLGFSSKCSYKPLVHIEFCSNRLYFTSGGWCFAPKIGKVLLKFGYLVNPPVNVSQESMLRGICLGLKQSCCFLLPLMTVIDRVLLLTEGVEAYYQRDEIHKFKLKQKLHFTNDTLSDLEQVYGWDSTKQKEWSGFVNNLQLGDSMDHPYAMLFFDKDTNGPKLIFPESSKEIKQVIPLIRCNSDKLFTRVTDQLDRAIPNEEKTTMCEQNYRSENRTVSQDPEAVGSLNIKMLKLLNSQSAVIAEPTQFETIENYVAALGLATEATEQMQKLGEYVDLTVTYKSPYTHHFNNIKEYSYFFKKSNSTFFDDIIVKTMREQLGMSTTPFKKELSQYGVEPNPGPEQFEMVDSYNELAIKLYSRWSLVQYNLLSTVDFPDNLSQSMIAYLNLRMNISFASGDLSTCFRVRHQLIRAGVDVNKKLVY